MTLELAQQELRACAGSQFDPDIIEALLAEIAVSELIAVGSTSRTA